MTSIEFVGDAREALLGMNLDRNRLVEHVAWRARPNTTTRLTFVSEHCGLWHIARSHATRQGPQRNAGLSDAAGNCASLGNLPSRVTVLGKSGHIDKETEVLCIHSPSG